MTTRGLSFAKNNAIALLALFVALGGTGYAASGGFTSGGKLQACVGGKGGLTLLKSGKKCKHGQKLIAWNQTGPQGATGPGGIAGLNGASVPSATNATNATNAVTAQTANNALELGGVPASEFTHRDCGSVTGQIKGWVQIPEGLGTGGFAPFSGYNCSGKPIELESPATGDYVVRFVDSPATIALATATAEAGVFPDYASVHRLAPGEFEVATWNLHGEPVGSGFELLVP